MGRMMTLTAADGHVLEAWRAEPDAAPKGGVVVPPSATLALERTLALFDRHIAR